MVGKSAISSMGDARLAVHAAGSLPAWLWMPDGTRVLWANPVGAQLFGARNTAVLSEKIFGPADPHRRQIAQLATRLPADGRMRLERLRGFGAALGRLVTCACSRLVLADGTAAVLIVAAEGVGRTMPLAERLQRLVEDSEMPMASFGRDGLFVGASKAARAMAAFRSLSDAGLDGSREQALRDGRAVTPVGDFGHLVLQRVGSGADIGLVAMFEPAVLAALRPALPEPVEDVAPTEPLQNEPPELPTEPIDELPARTQPLRFVWTVDAQGHFAIRSDELEALVGMRNATGFDTGWASIADSGVDADGRFVAAVATRAVWSGVRVTLPADGLEGGLPAELSGLPLFDGNGFAGYRGFGICHDLGALSALDALRRREPQNPGMPRSLSAHSTVAPAPYELASIAPPPNDFTTDKPADSCQTVLAADPAGEPALNVVPFRPQTEPATPALTAVESNAFDELARELSARLDSDSVVAPDHAPAEAVATPVVDPISTMHALLDAVGDALLIVDANGSIEFANRAAATLFGRGADALVQTRAADLLTPASADQFGTWLASPDGASHDIEMQNGTPLTVRLTPAPGSSVGLILQNVEAQRRQDLDLAIARRDATRTAAEKTTILSRISDELRAPLTAIIGFADVMIDQRFGPLGNERYGEYLKDIRGCGERVIAIVDDLLDLASVESGKRDLEFTNQDLNELVEQCVAAMQPQANRERIIIRSSLSHVLPPVLADARALRQIVVNLIGNSIHLANAGGQVIVSTAASQDGEVTLRVRDSGHGLNDNEVASALAPFRAAEDADEPAAIRLSLTRALVHANRARFSVKAAPYSGTLIEVAFAAGPPRASL